MCRLAYITNEALEFMSLADVTELLVYLETVQGGDGNGYGGFVEGLPIFEKGTELSMEDVARTISSITWDIGVIVHTRKASMGSVCDENCHPFLRGNTFLAHNGHWATDAKAYIKVMAILGEEITKIPGKRLIDMTDSEVISYLISKNGEAATELAQGVILTMTPQNVRVHNHWGEFKGVEIDPDIWVFASGFPHSYTKDIYELSRNSIAHLHKPGAPVLQTGEWELEIDDYETFRTYGGSYTGYSTIYDKRRAIMTALPSPQTQTKNKKKRQTTTEILDKWEERFFEFRKVFMEQETKNWNGGSGEKLTPRKLTKSEKKHAKTAGKLLLKRLKAEVSPKRRMIELMRFSRPEQAAVEISLLLSARTVAIPMLRLADFASTVSSHLLSKNGGTK